MGTPALPNEPGTLCNVCFGPGNPFPLPTPKYINMVVAGVRPGRIFYLFNGFLPNGIWRLQQWTDCSWRLVILNHIFLVAFTPSRTIVTIEDSSSYFFFQAVFFSGVCVLHVDNIYQSWNDYPAFAGTVDISWDLGGL